MYSLGLHPLQYLQHSVNTMSLLNVNEMFYSLVCKPIFQMSYQTCVDGHRKSFSFLAHRNFILNHLNIMLSPDDKHINLYLITDPDNITDTCGVDTISPC